MNLIPLLLNNKTNNKQHTSRLLFCTQNKITNSKQAFYAKNNKQHTSRLLLRTLKQTHKPSAASHTKIYCNRKRKYKNRKERVKTNILTSTRYPFLGFNIPVKTVQAKCRKIQDKITRKLGKLVQPAGLVILCSNCNLSQILANIGQN